MQSIQQLHIGQILRDPRPKREKPVEIDGCINFYAATAVKGAKFVPFDRGINPTAVVDALDGPRRPVIVISSSPHKSGSVTTPWEDLIAPDQGYVRYLGDAKSPGMPAHESPGNKLLLRELEQFHGHPSQAQRMLATPLVFFRREQHQTRQKGFPRFQGFGALTGARLVSQYSDAAGNAFPNYEFTCVVMSLANEAELFDWAWINARRDPERTLEDTHASAPKSWREWVASGDGDSHQVRRKVIRRALTPVRDQMPTPGSADNKVLTQVYAYYEGKKPYFESLAAAVAARVLGSSATSYRTHGVTRGSGDGGIDFVAQLDVGAGFSRTPLVVLGQAKCVAPTARADATDLARIVARLRRGWLGVFVTTGAISVKAQGEIFDDRYPLVLIPGLRVAETVREMLIEHGHRDVKKLLGGFDEEYENSDRVVDPEQFVV
jgi:hypothetical protein